MAHRYSHRLLRKAPTTLVAIFFLMAVPLILWLVPEGLAPGWATPRGQDTTPGAMDAAAMVPPDPGASPTADIVTVPGGRARWADITLRGTNYSPTGADWCHEDPDPWNCVWMQWDWSKISKEIDLAAGLDLNGFRLIGGAGAVYKGEIPEARYMAQLDQIAGYLAAKGMYYYPTCVAAGKEHMGGIPIAWLAAFCGRMAQVVEKYDNVPGMDVVQEYNGCWGDNDGTGTYRECLQSAHQLADAVRRAAPALPITFSDAIEFFDPQKMADYAPIVDYFDIHNYDMHSPGDFRRFFSDPQHKQLVFGEIGVQGEQTGTFFGNVLQIVQAYHINVFQWAIVEGKGGYGLYDEAGGVDGTKAAAYRHFPTSGFLVTAPPSSRAAGSAAFADPAFQAQ